MVALRRGAGVGMQKFDPTRVQPFGLDYPLGKPIVEVEQSGIAWADWFSGAGKREITSRPDVDTDRWSL